MPQPKLRKVKILWTELQEILTKAGTVGVDEEIEGVTLVKPRQLLIHTQNKTGVRS